jgi:hypothetical protein
VHATAAASGIVERLEQLPQLAFASDERILARRRAYDQLLRRQRSIPRSGAGTLAVAEDRV